MSAYDLLKQENHELLISQIERPGAERNVIAYILKHPDSIYDVVAKLKVEDFNNSLNKTIYQVMSRLSEKGVLVSIENIMAVARGNDYLDKEGEEYLEFVSKTDITGVDLEYNVNLVKVASIKRKSYYAGLRLLQECIDDGDVDDADTFIGRQQNRFMELSLQASSDRVTQIGEGIDEWLEERANNPTTVPGLRSGFPDLDEAIGGFRPGRFYLFSARSKVGKSLLLNNFAVRMAVKDDVPLLYLDTEMDTEEDVRPRLLAIISGVDEERINNGMFKQDPDEYKRVRQAAERLKAAPFYHAYTPNFSTVQLCSLIRKYYVKHRIQAVFFDYIKMPLNEGDRGMKEYQLLGKLTASLKDVCGELRLPCISAAQLNREAVRVKDGEFDEGMIGASDRIFHNVSYAFYLWRKTLEQIQEDGGDESGNMVLHLGGSRHGGDYTGWLRAEEGNARIVEVHKI